MTRKKESNDAHIMRSNKKGYLLVSHKEILSFVMTMNFMAERLEEEWNSGEYKPSKLDIIREVRKVVCQHLNAQDDKTIEQQVIELLDQSNTSVWEKVDK